MRHSLREESGLAARCGRRKGEKAVTSRRKRAFYGSTPSLPLLESVSAVSWAVRRPPARSLGRPAHSLTDVSTSEEGLVSHSAPGSEKTAKE